LFPFSDVASSLGLKENASGRDSYFSPEGKIALMLLKSCTSLSDKNLIALSKRNNTSKTGVNTPTLIQKSAESKTHLAFFFLFTAYS